MTSYDERLPEDPSVLCRIDYRVGKEEIAIEDQTVKLSIHAIAFDEDMNEVNHPGRGGSVVTISTGQPSKCSSQFGFQMKETLTPGWLVWVVLIEDKDATKPLKVLSYHTSRMNLLK